MELPYGKTVLISGGARGIGLATATAFLAADARVAIFSKDPESLHRAEAALGGRGALRAFVADVRDRPAVERVVCEIEREWERIDVLVNNAGIAWDGDFAAQDPDSIAALIDVNVTGVLQLTRLVLPGMIRRGRGVIVNISSGAGLDGFAGLAAYCASKFALVGFTAALDLEVRDQGVRVYALCPGAVATDMQQAFSGERRGLPPARVAERIVELAGPRPRARAGRWVTLP
jgi:3-oxoacyl-[acyl-carrier protein] reductase